MYKDNVVSFEDRRIKNVLDHFKATGKLKFGMADIENTEKMLETFSNWNLKTNGEYAETFAQMHQALMEYTKQIVEGKVASMMVVKYRIAGIDKQHSDAFKPLYDFTMNSTVFPPGPTHLGEPEVIGYVSVIKRIATSPDIDIDPDVKSTLLFDFKEKYQQIHDLLSNAIDTLQNLDYTVPNVEKADESTKNYIERLKVKVGTQIETLVDLRDFIEKYIGDL